MAGDGDDDVLEKLKELQRENALLLFRSDSNAHSHREVRQAEREEDVPHEERRVRVEEVAVAVAEQIDLIRRICRTTPAVLFRVMAMLPQVKIPGLPSFVRAPKNEPVEMAHQLREDAALVPGVVDACVARARSECGDGAVVGGFRCAFNIEKTGTPAGAMPAVREMQKKKKEAEAAGGVSVADAGKKTGQV